MNKTRWLAIVGRKGGSGKTALALGLAAHYARAGRRVLLVDLDPQGSASLTLGDGAEGGHLAEVLAGTAAPEMVTYDTFSNCPPLALLSGGPALENVNAARPLRDVLAVRQDSALALALNAGSLPPASGRAAADLEAVAAWIDKQTERKGTP